MVALRNARVRRYVLLCHFFCFWHFAARTLQFSALPPNSKLLKDVEHNEVPSWIREQICDLGYHEDIANKVVKALASFTMEVLMEMSHENIVSVLTKAKIDESDAIAVAMGLSNRIQKGITQPQPVSWRRLVLVVARVRCVLFLVDHRVYVSVVALLGFRFRAMFPRMSRPSHEHWMMQSWKGKFSERKRAVSSCKTFLKFGTRSSSTCGGATQKLPTSCWRKNLIGCLCWARLGSASPILWYI